MTGRHRLPHSDGPDVIISHKHRFMFFPVPKTGTHSVRGALRAHLGEDDLEQVGLFVHKRLPFPELAALNHGHLGVTQIKPIFGAERFTEYFKFAFVRNPYARFVSYCAFMSRQSQVFETQATAFMKHVIGELRPFDHVLFRPQHEMLCDENGELAMDFIGRVERMQADYDRVCERVGIPTAPLERVNASRHHHHSEYYDDELKAWVADFYRRDLELFGYGFDDARDATTDTSGIAAESAPTTAPAARAAD